MHRFTVTHTYPNITEEEREEIKRDILLKMYNKIISNEKRSLDMGMEQPFERG